MVSIRYAHPPPTVAVIERHTYDLHLLRNGTHDPTTRVSISPAAHVQHARIQRATLTPQGAGTIQIDIHTDANGARLHEVRSWGPGGDWLAGNHLRLAAHTTDCTPLTPHHPAVTRALRDYGQLHLPATDTPYHELLPAILGQRITAAQALTQWVRLCEHFGETAPGPLSLRLPPMPERLLQIASWEFHQLGIEEQRARALRVAARQARYIDATREVSGAQARESLMRLPGIGVWTAAVTVGVSHGDPDALPIGDFHVKNTVAWALTGRARGTDEAMLHTLAPYAGQRWQVVRLLEKSGLGAPKFGPRRRLIDIARI